MRRRKFVQNTLVGVPFTFLTPFLFASCGKDQAILPPNGKAVLVVGGGISGLAAATKLKQKGFAVTVLEAQEKPGGRVRTNRNSGLVFDEGASWIHGPKGNPITELVAPAGAITFLTDDDNVKVFDKNGMAYSDSLLTSTEEDYEQALRQVQKAGLQYQSFQTVFSSLFPGQVNSPLWKYMLSATLLDIYIRRGANDIP